MVNQKIQAIEGIGPANGEKLRAAGVIDTDALLEQGCTKPGRVKLAQATGISESKILGWVNMADLFRVKGVGSEYAELLEVAGVDTVKELATRKAANLTAKMAEVNEAKHLTRRAPTESEVSAWVAHAKELPPKVSH